MAAPTPDRAGPRPNRRGTALLAIVVAAEVLAAFALTGPDLRFPVLAGLLSVTGVVYLGMELVALGPVLLRGDGPPVVPADARPADGVVDVAAMTGVRAIPLAEEPQWRRFEAIDGDPGPARPLIGGRPALLGRVALISIFIGRDGRDWTGGEVARAHRSLEWAGRWIEREAGRWGVPVNVVLPDTFFQWADHARGAIELAFQPEGDDVGPFEARAAFKANVLVARVASDLGFADALGLAAAIEPRVGADASGWLVHLLESGRSFAIPAHDPESAGLGLAVCYAREASFPTRLEGDGRVDPITVVHELLHLFGASDAYGQDLSRFPGKSVTNRDVMRLDRNRLDQLRIGRRTAGEIGWARWAKQKPAGSPRGPDGPVRAWE